MTTLMKAGEMAVVPQRITAESGHKAALMGEFHERVSVSCDTCQGDGYIDERLGGQAFSDPEAKCPGCDGWGTVSISVPVSWTTIKAIHRKIVEVSMGDCEACQ